LPYQADWQKPFSQNGSDEATARQRFPNPNAAELVLAAKKKQKTQASKRLREKKNPPTQGI